MKPRCFDRRSTSREFPLAVSSIVLAAIRLITGHAWNQAAIGDPCVIHDASADLFEMRLSVGGEVPTGIPALVRIAEASKP
jgi:hypothetical protein